MDLDALADFNLVARHGGFGRASRATGRAKATLSRRVLDLERQLGVRLIDRGSRSLRLTEEGRRLHARTDGLVTEILDAGAEVRDGLGRPRGRLRISAPLLLSHVALGRVAAGFVAAHSEMRLEVTAEDRLVDLVEEGYDLVIRTNPPASTELVGRRILSDEVLVVAPAGLGPGAAEAGAPVRAVALSGRTAAGWTYVRDGAARTVAPDVVLRLPSLLMVRDAVLAGAGAALLPRSIVGGDVAAGRLGLWGALEGGAVELWALHPSGRLMSAKVRAFIDHLLAAFPDATLRAAEAQAVDRGLANGAPEGF